VASQSAKEGVVEQRKVEESAFNLKRKRTKPGATAAEPSKPSENIQNIDVSKPILNIKNEPPSTENNIPESKKEEKKVQEAIVTQESEGSFKFGRRGTNVKKPTKRQDAVEEKSKFHEEKVLVEEIKKSEILEPEKKSDFLTIEHSQNQETSLKTEEKSMYSEPRSQRFINTETTEAFDDENDYPFDDGWKCLIM